jgi:hypothetical protein
MKWLTNLWRRWKDNRAWKKKLEEMRKRDPFIYK